MVDFIEKAYAQAQERAQAQPQTTAPSGPASKHRLASGAPRPASAGALARARRTPHGVDGRLGQIAELSPGQEVASSGLHPLSASASPAALATAALDPTLSASASASVSACAAAYAPASTPPRPGTISPRNRAAFDFAFAPPSAPASTPTSASASASASLTCTRRCSGRRRSSGASLS